MSSLINVVKEAARQAATGDVNYLQKILYYFELRLPPQVAEPLTTGTYFFPLVINPESIMFSEPYSVEATPTQGGGLYVEENGIIQRSLRIRGQTGFKPRPMPNNPLQLVTLKTEQKSFSRSLPPVTLASISGQRHMHYLQDAVFRTYADFKSDPSTADDTQLIFHNPKDDEHWLVVPRSFTLERNAQRPTQYQYDIDLLVVAKAEAANVDFSEDKSLLDEIKDAIATVQSAIDLANGALHDLSALASTLKGLVNDVAKIISNVTNVVTAAQNFVNGVTALIQAPYAILNATTGLLDAGLSFYDNLTQSNAAVATIPDPILQALRQLGDALDIMGTHPECFETPAQAQVRAIKQSQQLALANTQAALQAASDAAPPASFAAVGQLGTGLMPGDLLRSQAQTGNGSQVIQYTGASQHTLVQGETLVNLAARYLGDARQWQYIAIVNGLKPPFVAAQSAVNLLGQTDENGLPGVIGLGSQVLIPNFSKPPEAQPLLPVLGVQPDQPAAVHLLGSDLMLAPRGNANAAVKGAAAAQLDLVIDAELGGVDVKTVQGVDNMAQSIRTRVTTEQGSDTLYQNVGLQRLIALNILPVDLATAKFRIQESILSDARVATINSITFDQDSSQPDLVNLVMEVALRGFSKPTAVAVSV